MSKLIAVDAGHGLHTAGKRTPDGEREWSFNNRVVIALIDELHRLGLRTIRLDDPSGQRDVPLGERTRKANNETADVLVSVHHNALTGRWGNHTGTEIYSYPGSKKSKELADKLQPKLAETYGLRNRGAKTANFHMLRESKMPAILTEGGYMDSTIDIVKMRDNEVLKQAGITIARNVAEWLGVGGKVNTQSTVAKPTQPKKQANTGGSIVDYLNQNKINSSFANRKKLAREYLGISNYSGTAKQNIDLLNAMRSGKKPTQPQPVAKSISQMADEIIANRHGSGHANRQRSLGVDNATYQKVRAEVNRRAGVQSKPKKSVKQLADEILKTNIKGNAARAKHLGLTLKEYEPVRQEINRRYK